jgi:N-acetylglucosamine-6-phosphate deacetylase
VRLGVKHALVGGAILPGDVAIDDGRIVAVGVAPGGRTGLAVPGFVDLQVNGFAGVDFLSADADGYRRAGEALAATGVTAYQPTFISSPIDSYWPALDLLAALRAAGRTAAPRILGAHLEGPFLSRRWPGAHDPGHLLDPDLPLAAKLCEAGPVAQVTLAPELTGGLELVSELVSRGVVVAVGHTDADAAVAHAAFDRGARVITHIHNAHRRWQPRDPGVAGAALVRRDVTVTAILDGVHLSPETAYATFLATGGRFALITDAIEAAGCGPGTYRLANRTVHVAEDGARLESGTLAGGVGTMDRALRDLERLGASIPEAAHAASGAPALAAGRADLGVLRPRGLADVVVLDDALQVTRTIVGGAEAFAGH